MRVVPPTAAVAAALVALAADARPADACTCAPIERVWPADGTANVPTNTQIFVLGGSGSYALDGPDGPMTIASVTTVDDNGVYALDVIALDAPLAPGTDYTIRSAGAALAQFRTAAGPDTEPPGAVSIANLALQQADTSAGFSCGSEFWDVDLRLTVPDDAIAFELVVRRDGVGPLTYLVLADDIGALSDWNEGCGLAIPLAAGAEYTFDVTARDAAGNLGPTASASAVVTACEDIADPEAFTGNLARCVPEGEGGGDGGGGGCNSGGGAPLALVLALALPLARRRRVYAERSAR